jgi:hypothetical protein
VRPAADGEKAGIPSVAITVAGFTEVAKEAAEAAGVEGLRVAAYPGAVGVHLDEIRSNIEENLFEQIVDGLTKHETDEAIGVRKDYDSEEIVFKGTFEEVNEFFFSNEWSDGLPIVPPTVDTIERYLGFTDRSPDEKIAILPQANLVATPFNIAANAIMAGCRPEHMPLLIAAAEALGDEYYNLNNIGTTWGVYPYVLISGPIVRQLDIPCEGQLISRGSNPSLGRAVGLIIRNIGGYRPGKNYMGTFGYPLVFAIAENEKENPWEPFHVEQGFDRSTSAVTACATVTWGWPPSPYSTTDKTAAQSALELLSLELTKKPCLAKLAEVGPEGMRNMIMLMLSPPVAKSIADAGYSKQDIREYLYENARVPLREIDWNAKYAHPEALSAHEKVELGIYPKDYLVGLDEMVRVLPSPEVVHIVVCGDPSRNRVMTLWGGYVKPATKEVKLPANWDQLLDNTWSE